MSSKKICCKGFLPTKLLYIRNISENEIYEVLISNDNTDIEGIRPTLLVSELYRWFP